ncbi:Uma2 family endonuclease [Anaplasma marginale]|uniref:Uma2 family endonuclease n=1 Tax=Anaplasma marginale TaxID=770 RepID=UPI0005B50855|nr:Uma2 family endonuclease [Anaplasma marginale]
MILSNKSTQKISLEQFLKQPETKPASEYIEGKIYQKPMPQGQHSIIQGSLVTAINQVSQPKKLALALPELRCTFAARSLVPDIAVFEWQNIPLNDSGEIVNKVEIAPDWIIEILSLEQSPNRVIEKIIFCINNGTKLAWFVDPEDRSIMIFQPNQLPAVKYNTDVLTVLKVLEEWQLKVADVFTWLKPAY